MLGMNTQALRLERAKLVSDAEAIQARAAEAGRGMSGEESQEFERIMDAADERRKAVAAAEQEERRAESQRQRLDEHKAELAKPTGTIFGRQIKGGDGASLQPIKFGKHEVRIDPNTPMGMRASPEYVRAFGDYLRSGRDYGAVMQTDLADQGGYLAPPQFVAELIATLNDTTVFRGISNVMTTNAPSVTMPRRTARAAAAVWSAEMGQPTADTAFRLGTYKLTPHYMTGSNELSQDLLRSAVLSPDTIVRGEIGYQRGDLEERAFAAGDGNDKPLGVFTPSSQGITTGRDISGSATAFETYVKAKMSIRDVYRRGNLRWVMNRKAMETLMTVKDSTGQPIYLVSIRDGEPDRLLGVPVLLSEYAPTGTGALNAYQANDYVCVIGDFRYYDILDGLDLVIRRHEDSAYDVKNQVGYIWRAKVDGSPRIEEAFARVKAS